MKLIELLKDYLNGRNLTTQEEFYIIGVTGITVEESIEHCRRAICEGYFDLF